MNSLCKLCSAPDVCPLCEVMRNPVRLDSKAIARAARAFVMKAPSLPSVDSQSMPTVPTPQPKTLALAPAPTPPPSIVVRDMGDLKKNDWAGLWRRVERNLLTEREAMDIGAQWAGLQAVTHA
mgnify:CR=1 FL=1